MPSASSPAASEPATDGPGPEVYTHRQVLKVLSGLLLAMLTAMLSTSVIGTALPTIVGELGGQEQLSWVASATLLTMTVSTPLWGKLSDLYGRKPMFVLALGVFVIASSAAGLSQDIGQLIASRALQGLGAGGLMSLTQVILGDVVEPRERGRYSGYLGSVFGISTVAGPLVGGFLVDTSWLGWRWCFFVCVPLALVAFTVIHRYADLPRVRREAVLDWFGAGTVTGGASCLMLMLTLGGNAFAWNSVWTYALCLAAVGMFGLAVVAERRSAEPILPPRLFRNRSFVLIAIASLFTGVAMFGVMIYLPQYLQVVKGMSPTASGLMMLPMVLCLFVSSVGCGSLVTRTGRWKVFPVTGLALVGIALFLLSRLGVEPSTTLVGVDVAVLGVGLGASMQIMILAAQNAVTRHDLAAATTGITFFRSLGGAVGVAASGAILGNRLAAEMEGMLRASGTTVPAGEEPTLGSPDAIHGLPEPLQGIVIESFTRAMHMVFLVGVPVAAAGFLTMLAVKELPLRSARDPAEVPDEPPRTPLVHEDALRLGAMLVVIARGVAPSNAGTVDSALVSALAAVAHDRSGTERERALAVAETLLRPVGRDLLNRAVRHSGGSHRDRHTVAVSEG